MTSIADVCFRVSTASGGGRGLINLMAGWWLADGWLMAGWWLA